MRKIIWMFFFWPMVSFSQECMYGTPGCNTCVNDVAKNFLSISTKHKNFYVNRSGPGINIYPDYPWRPLLNHVQSVVRIPGLENENWLAMTRSSEKMGGSGLYLIRFKHINSDGSAWKNSTVRNSNSEEIYFYPIQSSMHPGGIQALGSVLFVGNECSDGLCDGHIRIYDVANPYAPALLNTLQVAAEIEARDHPTGKLRSTASSVAAVKLDDGSTLVYVGGPGSGRYGWFYLSDPNPISAFTRWRFINSFHTADFKDTPWMGWENASFVNECGTGTVYYIGMGERKSYANLYRLIRNRNGTFMFQFVSSRKFNASFFNTFRMGGGLHVTPGHEMVFYNTSRFGRKVMEFH